MRTIVSVVVATCMLVAAPCAIFGAEADTVAPAASLMAGKEADYRIGAGDTLNIDVWKDTALTRLLTVLPDGKISYPLVGEVMAAGRTVAQVKKEIEGKLARYLTDPVVTVEVRQMSSYHIYVMGRVNVPGRSILTSNVNVLQALAIAGGPNAFANRSKIRIFREEDGNSLSIPFDYDEVTAGKNLGSNILLKRGDVVYVP